MKVLNGNTRTHTKKKKQFCQEKVVHRETAEQRKEKKMKIKEKKRGKQRLDLCLNVMVIEKSQNQFKIWILYV